MREQEPRSFGASELIAADKIQGKDIFNRQGENLGKVRGIYIDKTSGKVEFLTVAQGGVLGAGAKHHPLPWATLDYDPDRKGFVIDLDKALLDAAPCYAVEELEEDGGWVAQVIEFYRTRPMETFGGSAAV
ncbi:MAG TPA: PRC-barrel domain-containing protein [Caulobacteraceae bacterium]|jgi:sporulation protein YlmC with PRC-barrel domain|nr:PRC-barrel domain-containing protein [Caulobacteraceae bacterium]